MHHPGRRPAGLRGVHVAHQHRDPGRRRRVLDGRTLAIPDRRGNKRADTAHNLLADARISAAMLVPGRTDVLHISGTAYLTDDPALLADMALGGAVPQTALIVTLALAEVRRSDAIAAGRIWDRAGHADADTARTLMALSMRQIGEMKPALRWLGKPLSALARPMQWLLDRSYRRALKSEGYGDGDARA
ncbi:hypothetical protein [Acrocarpospora sp. B8E8]|uniref:hypothetical protein n=1 Tax=Acrocarpospora sp. B8E8 TaxID=3153572 RepID=UPI00325C4F8A